MFYPNEFNLKFERLLQKAGVSCYKIGQYAGSDLAYLSRLKTGERQNPSTQTLFKISFALVHCSDKVTLSDIEELFNAVGKTILHRKD